MLIPNTIFILTGKGDILDHVAPDEIFDASSSIEKKGYCCFKYTKKSELSLPGSYSQTAIPIAMLHSLIDQLLQ